MPPVLHFNHTNIYQNPALAFSSPFKVGRPTSITISVDNSGTDAGVAEVHLWWLGPCAGAHGPTNLLYKCDAPNNAGQPIIFSVNPGGEGHLTVSWTPNARDFPVAMGHFVFGAIFAQLVSQPVAPVFAGDTSALPCWNPAYRLCALHNTQVETR
jgi:hypothetical protein